MAITDNMHPMMTCAVSSWMRRTNSRNAALARPRRSWVDRPTLMMTDQWRA